MTRRLILAAALVAAVVVVVLLVTGGAARGSGYRVRAIFDNGAFMVHGRAGPGRRRQRRHDRIGQRLPARRNGRLPGGKPVSVPGKAIIVMDITDPGFQDFRSDASCLIRPQSLIGEKFVDCRPTLPRAPGSPAPPPLKQIDSGEPGAGEYLLPLGSNGTSVDPDLINDIQTLPYAQRFRLILNELGAGLAGRGEDLEVLVKRANPVLRDVDTLFGILSAQRNQLAQLRQRLRRRSCGRSRASAPTSPASSSTPAPPPRPAPNAAPSSKSRCGSSPSFLTEFRLTMRSLQGFSDAATPVFEDLGEAAPSLTDATRTLTPFSEATTVALKSLGNAGEASGPIFREADPVVRKTRDLAKSGVVADDRTGEAAHQHQADQGLGRPGRTDLQHDRGAQRVRPVRAFRSHPGDADELRRLHSRPERQRRAVRAVQRPEARPAAKRRQRGCYRTCRLLQRQLDGKDRRHRGASGPESPAVRRPDAGRPGRRRANRALAQRLPRPGAPPRSSTTSWGHEEPRRTSGNREQPGPGRGGDGAGRHRRRLPRLQRQQRPARSSPPTTSRRGCPTPTRWSRATRCGSAASASASSSPSSRSSSGNGDVAAELSLSLDKNVEPLPVDSTITVPPRSPRSGSSSSRSRRATPPRASPPAKRSRSPRPSRNRSTSTSSSTCSTSRPATRSARTWPASATPSPAAGRS